MRTSSPTVLGIDTSGPWCSVAVRRGDEALEHDHIPMPRGQAEALLPCVDEMLRAQGLVPADIDAIGVGVGPGNFTGIRIAVATARGLALGLQRPAFGVSGFEALVIAQGIDDELERLVTLPAPRAQSYAAILKGRQPVGTPWMIGPAHAPDVPLPPGGVLGHRAAEIAALSGARAIDAAPEQPALHVAQIAVLRWRADVPESPPAPLYVRPADAAPPRSDPVLILP